MVGCSAACLWFGLVLLVLQICAGSILLVAAIKDKCLQSEKRHKIVHLQLQSVC